MDTPRYLQILWSYKWLLAVGVVVAALAGLFAGFTISNGQIVSRAEATYTSATTLMLQSEHPTLFQAQIPGQEISQTTTPAQAQNLTDSAVIYAYLASSDEIKKRVEGVVGRFADTDGLTAVSRTTQPPGDETFPGRLQLPIIDIVGTAATPERASQISRAADVQFRDYILQQQQKAQVPDAIRVDLVTLQKKPPVQADGSNPIIPVAVAALGVFLAFIALIFIIHGARTSRGDKKRERKLNRRLRRGRREPSEDDESIEPDLVDEVDDDRPRVPVAD
jgi:hypothetical protein